MVRVSGCILHFLGVESGKPRDDLKNELLPFGTVAFVDFPQGKTEVSSESEYLRFLVANGYMMTVAKILNCSHSLTCQKCVPFVPVVSVYRNSSQLVCVVAGLCAVQGG